MEDSKVNIRKAGKGSGYMIEITNTPYDVSYAVTEEELRQIVLIGEVILRAAPIKD